MQYKKPLISAAFATGILLAGTVQAEWKYNTEAFFAASDDASVSGIRWLQPWWQNGKSMAYSDLRILKSDKSTEEVNLGAGFRQLSDDETAIWGGYGFFDYRSSATNRSYTQITLGAEYLLDKWEFRSNAYLPLKDEYIVAQLEDEREIDDNFTGNTVTRITTITPGQLVVEEALKGYDFEVGYLLPGSEDFEIRANLGAYQYSAPVAGSTQGLRGRVEAFPRENFKVSVSIESDDLFGTRSFLELSLPLGQKIGRPRKRSLNKRMTQFAYRDIDVRETSRLDESKRTKNGPGSTTTEESTPAENIIHIDSETSVSVASANGTIELPFKSIADCAASTQSLNCGDDEQAKIIYLHASPDATRNGNAQTYIGNLSINNGQAIVGDGVTTGVFSNLSTKVSPILLGADGDINPVLTLSGTSEASGLQLGWTYTQTTAGSSTPSNADISSEADMPDTAIHVINKNNQSAAVKLSDIRITGASALDGDSSRISSTNNFSTGIHFESNSTTNTVNTLTVTNLNASFILGDAVYAQLESPTTPAVLPPSVPSPEVTTFNTQSLVIVDSTISKNGRGIHATVNGDPGSTGEQNITVSTNNSSASEEADLLTNSIDFNLNEGILVENLTIDTYESDLTNNLADPSNNPLPYLARQNLNVTNALIENNQGAGIQTSYGAVSTSNTDDTDFSSVKLRNVNLFLNEGSGLVLGGFSTNMEADIQNTSISGNLEKSVSNDFGKRLDGVAIDCESAAINDCTTLQANTNRTSTDFRKTGYGLYAKNMDTANSLSTQKITISENFQSTLHAENSAQVFLESIDLNLDSSSQSLSILDDSPSSTEDPDFIKLIGTGAGEVQFINGAFTVSTKTGASIAGIAYCDKTSTAGTENDGETDFITFSGLISEDDAVEKCP